MIGMVTADKISATLRKHGYRLSPTTDPRVDAMSLAVGTGDLFWPEADEVVAEIRSIVEPLGWQANWAGFDVRVTPAEHASSTATGDE